MAAEIMYVTVAGAGDKSGDTWAKAMGYAEWEADLEGASEAGDIYYVKEGTYTLTSALNPSGRPGTGAAPITCIGVAVATTNEPPIYSDWATGDARPLIAGGANFVNSGTHYKWFNFRITATATYGILTGISSVVWNTKISGSPTYCLYLGTGGKGINCDLSTTGGTAVYSSGTTGTIIYCYVHDCSVDGILVNQYGTRILFNIIDTCVGDGVDLVSFYNAVVMNNTIYNCGNGIKGTTAYANVLINNIINDCTVGANWTTQEDSNVWINNNLEGNGTPVINVATVLPHSDFLGTTVNPAFTDDSGGDFSLASGSGCIDAGLSIALGVG